MKLIPIFLTTFILSSFSFGSGPHGVYAILTDVKVDTKKDEMVLIGKFKIAQDNSAIKFSKPEIGYMFYHSIRNVDTMKEFVGIAKSGKCIAFGDSLRNNGTVRAANATEEKADRFPYRGSGQLVLDSKTDEAQFKRYCADLK